MQHDCPVADLETFREGFSFTEMPAKLEVKTKQKKVITSFWVIFLLTATSYPLA